MHTQEQLCRHWLLEHVGAAPYKNFDLCPSHIYESCVDVDNEYLHLCERLPPPQEEFLLTTESKKEVAMYLQEEIRNQVHSAQDELLAGGRSDSGE